MSPAVSIEEICREQGSWIAQLEKQLAEEKRSRGIIISAWHGWMPEDLPPKLVLGICADDEL